MKKFIYAIGLTSFIIGISFYSGTVYNSDPSVESETEQIKYDMIGYYLDEDRDFAQEAREIQSQYRTNMSTSKIKHLLIYMDGMAKEYDVNYNLIKAVIQTESSWNVKARSRVNALGLMQVMKACATDYKTPHSEMYDPYVNVTIGIKYLSKLIERFDDTQTALVAYNEGPRHAERYKREYIDNSRYVNKVTTHFLTFQPQENLAYND